METWMVEFNYVDAGRKMPMEIKMFKSESEACIFAEKHEDAQIFLMEKVS